MLPAVTSATRLFARSGVSRIAKMGRFAESAR
jgi:hypothetical protein